MREREEENKRESERDREKERNREKDFDVVPLCIQFNPHA